jgi:hypothetical protein
LSYNAFACSSVIAFGSAKATTLSVDFCSVILITFSLSNFFFVSESLSLLFISEVFSNVLLSDLVVELSKLFLIESA